MTETENIQPQQSVLRAEGLVKRYGKRTVVNDVNINVRQGEKCLESEHLLKAQLTGPDVSQKTGRKGRISLGRPTFLARTTELKRTAIHRWWEL